MLLSRHPHAGEAFLGSAWQVHLAGLCSAAGGETGTDFEYVVKQLGIRSGVLNPTNCSALFQALRWDP